MRGLKGQAEGLGLCLGVTGRARSRRGTVSALGAERAPWVLWEMDWQWGQGRRRRVRGCWLQGLKRRKGSKGG